MKGVKERGKDGRSKGEERQKKERKEGETERWKERRKEEGRKVSLLLTFLHRLMHVGRGHLFIVWSTHHIVALVLVRGRRLDTMVNTSHHGSVSWDVVLHVQVHDGCSR